MGEPYFADKDTETLGNRPGRFAVRWEACTKIRWRNSHCESFSSEAFFTGAVRIRILHGFFLLYYKVHFIRKTSSCVGDITLLTYSDQIAFWVFNEETKGDESSRNGRIGRIGSGERIAVYMELASPAAFISTAIPWNSFPQVTVDTTVTFIVLILIALTICFEAIKDHIEESADRHMKPIISSLFGEMTVLGFLSIFTFCITELGGFEELSVHLFGIQEKEALLETFEFVHYMLFFIMVFFVTSVLNLVVVAKEIENKWLIMNRACLNPHYMAKLDELARTTSEVENCTFGRNLSSWPMYFVQSMILNFFADPTKSIRSELLLFRGLRNEFILERSSEPPFSPNDSNRVQEDFNYGNYLGVFMGHQLAHVVHVNHITWLFFASLTLFFYVLCLSLENEVRVSNWLGF